MAIDSNALSALAVDYTRRLTSVRGRRVQRLLKREFAGADHVILLQSASGNRAVLGFSASGAALCATDGRGKLASVFKWLHGSAEAVDTQFDLMKDSLPVLATRSMRLAALGKDVGPLVPVNSLPGQAARLLAMSLQALA